MHNPQVKAIRIIELLLLSSALVLFVVGSILEDTFFLRLATEALIFGGLAMSVDLLLVYFIALIFIHFVLDK